VGSGTGTATAAIQYFNASQQVTLATTPAGAAGTAGALYPAVLAYVSPEGFDLFQMILHKAMIVVGGMGSIVGSVIGASLLVYLLELLRQFKATQEIVFGALLLAFVLFQPRGLVYFVKRYVPGWAEPLHYASDSESSSDVTVADEVVTGSGGGAPR